MKIIAMYLPQFHNIRENDEWWGPGYTDWTAAKQAEVLYDGHEQPKVPLHKNYYDLLDKTTMMWQADLMGRYGIDGLCFYHYWFKEGKRLLERPAEQLLDWKEIDMPFCFAWDNCAWARSWSKDNDANPWTVKFEKNGQSKDKAILVEQDYGDEIQWKTHFEYLLPFWRDKRYIRVDNKPIVIIYRPALIVCLKDMTAKWNQWAQEAGLDGLYFIGANCSQYDREILDADLYHEPATLFGRLGIQKKRNNEPAKAGYDEAWSQLLNYGVCSKKTYYGGFVSYDDTPRRGRHGIVVYGSSPQKFKVYLSELLAKNYVRRNDFVFINAWNEWGEGMYLEPDEKHEFDYLSAVLYAKEHYGGYVEKYRNKLQEKKLWDNYAVIQERNLRYQSYWKIMDMWLCLKEEGITISSYLKRKGISTVAIYGMGMLGRHLYKELYQDSIEIKCCIDRSVEKIQLDGTIVTPEGEIPEVDAIIVTVTYDYRRIRDKLKERLMANFISLEDIIVELSKEL